MTYVTFPAQTVRHSLPDASDASTRAFTLQSQAAANRSRPRPLRTPPDVVLVYRKKPTQWTQCVHGQPAANRSRTVRASGKIVSVYTAIMREVEEEQNNSEYDDLSVGGTTITELRYAYDTALFSTTPEGLNNLVQAVNKHSSAYKLLINAAKTKIMELDKWQENTNIVIDNINVERVQSLQYLGAMFTTNGDGASNIKQRLATAVQALNNMQYLWKSASKELKLKVLRTCIFPIATYGCETWVLRKLDIKRINDF